MSENQELIDIKAKKNAAIWEFAGVFGGVASCICIFVQVMTEYNSRQPSTISMIYLLGFLMSYIFWMLYGIRFRHIAIWLPNGIAMTLQIALCIIVLIKAQHFN
jgi:uncharacterized protein with PQ loop repeat